MKSQADQHRTERAFQVGDWVFLRLQPYRQQSIHLRRNAKLSPKFYGPYKVLERIGEVAYKLELPSSSRVHPVFHVSCLKKRVGEGSLWQSTLPDLGHDGVLVMEPGAILDRKIVRQVNKAATKILVQWRGLGPDDATWEFYHKIQARYPSFLLQDNVGAETGELLRA